MVSEKIVLQVLAEQRDEIRNYKPGKLVSRKEESCFEWDSNLAQVDAFIGFISPENSVSS